MTTHGNTHAGIHDGQVGQQERLALADVATLTAPYLDLVPELPALISAGGR